MVLTIDNSYFVLKSNLTFGAPVFLNQYLSNEKSLFAYDPRAQPTII